MHICLRPAEVYFFVDRERSNESTNVDFHGSNRPTTGVAQRKRLDWSVSHAMTFTVWHWRSPARMQVSLTELGSWTGDRHAAHVTRLFCTQRNSGKRGGRNLRRSASRCSVCVNQRLGVSPPYVYLGPSCERQFAFLCKGEYRPGWIWSTLKLLWTRRLENPCVEGLWGSTQSRSSTRQYSGRHNAGGR